MSSIPILILTQKAEVKQGKIDEASIKGIQKYFKKKTEPEFLGSYKYRTTTLFLFGYTKGKAGTENKHELPPPHNETLVFGDIIIIASKDEKSFSNAIAFKTSDYETFYAKAFGGFDELDDEFDDDDDDDDEEEEEYNEDDDVINDVENEEENVIEYNDYEEEEVEEPKKVIKASKYNKTKEKEKPSFNLENQLTETSPKSNIRETALANMKTILNGKVTNKIIEEIEHDIYLNTLIEAESKHIIKHWDVKLFVEIYLANIRKVVGNLDSTSYVNNTELAKRFKNKEISVNKLCKMNYYELFSSKWKEAIEHQKMVEKIQLEGNKSMATDQFLCRKCFKRECTYYEMQTRSADEPMTIFINCLSCGNNWRQ